MSKFNKKIFLISAAVFLAVFLFFITKVGNVNATSGCCSWHGGVDYCDTSVGRYVCNDGTYSPSCGCLYIPPKPVCVKPTVGNKGTPTIITDGCNQNVKFEWDKGVSDEFYSVGISKIKGADPGPLSDTNERQYTFKNVAPGKWFVNIKPGRSCGWGDVYYWEVNVSDVVPEIQFKEKIISEEERELIYDVSCADKIEITPDIGIVKSNSGSIAINPKQKTTYTLTAYNKEKSNNKYLAVDYPLPKKEVATNSSDKQISENDNNPLSPGFIFVPIIIGFLWIINKLAIKK